MSHGIRRHFVDVREGQVHYRDCGDPANPVLAMFHASPGSSWSLSPLITELAKSRYVLALDTLGNGDSSPPEGDEPDVAYFADAHVRALQAIGVQSCDFYGTHTGAAICAEVSISHPHMVRRLVMDGVSLFDPKMRDSMLSNNHAPALSPDHAGSQLLRAWTLIRDAHLFWPWWNRVPAQRRDRGLPSADYLHAEVVEVLKALTTYHKSYRTALSYPKRERLPLVRHPTLVASSPTDPLLRFVEDVVAILPNGRPCITAGEDGPDQLAATAGAMLAFLNHG
jgi:pimeloyl-ACP methyl ester carboxylesterase